MLLIFLLALTACRRVAELLLQRGAHVWPRVEVPPRPDGTPWVDPMLLAAGAALGLCQCVIALIIDLDCAEHDRSCALGNCSCRTTSPKQQAGPCLTIAQRVSWIQLPNHDLALTAS